MIFRSSLLICCNTILLIVTLQFSSKAQLYVPSGLALNVSGSIQVSSGLDVINEGVINVDSGSLYLEKNLSGTGAMNASKGTIIFKGSTNQSVSFGASTYLKNITIQNSGGKVIFSNNIPVLTGTLKLVSGKAEIGNNNLVTEGLEGGSYASYIQTSGTGYFGRRLYTGLNVFYPVGNSAYNPVYVKTDRVNVVNELYRVRVLDEVYDNGMSGSVISRPRVKRTWDLQSENVNRKDSLDLYFSWNQDDRIGAFSVSSFFAFSDAYWRQQNGATNRTTNALQYNDYIGKLLPFSIQNQYQSIIGLKLYLQGLYMGAGLMQPALMNWGMPGATATQADSITLEVRDPGEGAIVGSPIKIVLNTSGNSQISVPGLAGPYYLAVKHPNSLETWSASPVILGDSVFYDFSTAANKAYGDNQVQIDAGKYAIWSGDINADGMIETSDYLSMENDVLSILFGYYPSDLTGDAVVETADYLLMENNILQIPFAVLPF